MPKRSAGLLLYRNPKDRLELFLVHPGGPLWASKDHGAWTIPKGEYKKDETPLEAAQREFHEETGFTISSKPENYIDLGSIRQKSGKIVSAWAIAGNCDPTQLVSNTCKLEWPPRSGKKIVIPEIDRGAWFSPTEARLYLREEQHPIIDRLLDHLANQSPARPSKELKPKEL